jgi:DNA polymerase III subunit delta
MILAKRPEIERFLKAPDPAIRAAVIHGKDRSGVAERAEILCKTVTPDLNDPFNVTVLTDSDIDGDETRLEEALTAMSLMASSGAHPPVHDQARRGQGGGRCAQDPCGGRL